MLEGFELGEKAVVLLRNKEKKQGIIIWVGSHGITLANKSDCLWLPYDVIHHVSFKQRSKQ